jgi:hypothetical protein
MNEILVVIGVVAAWILLNKYVLPKLGIGT